MIARTNSTIEAQLRQNSQPSSQLIQTHSEDSERSPMVENRTWQAELSQAICDPAELLQRLALPPSLLADAQAASRLFPLRVPLPYLRRIQPGNLNDPLLLQVLPLYAETLHTDGFVTDPLGEQEATKQPGLLHKYQGRVLLIASGACAINCRYCFRRHFPYEDNLLGTRDWEQSLRYVAEDPSIDEVILSGGDPLAANDKRLRWLLQHIEGIPHIKRLRIHTRLPIVIPQRVTDDLLDMLSNSRLQRVFVVHINHAQEIDAEVAETLAKLKGTGSLLLNQSVLLRGINDQVESLEQLSRSLFDCGVMPYYLHLLDPVQGVSHFDVPTAEGIRLVKALGARLPGYLVPKLVREEAGEPSKTLIPLSD